MNRRLYSEEEKQEIIKRVNELKNNGMSTAKACEAVGIKNKAYYHWVSFKSKKKSKIPTKSASKVKPINQQIMTLPIKDDDDKIVIMYGREDAIISAMDRLLMAIVKV